MNWALLPLRRYTDFSGRARRMEYWMFSLVTSVIGVMLIALGFVLSDLPFGDSAAFGDVRPSSILLGFGPAILFYLALIIPAIAVQVRRFHDRDMSGWWVLGFSILSNIPFLGVLISLGWLVILLLPGTPGPNRFGPDPKDPYGGTDIDQVFS